MKFYEKYTQQTSSNDDIIPNYIFTLDKLAHINKSIFITQTQWSPRIEEMNFSIYALNKKYSYRKIEHPSHAEPEAVNYGFFIRPDRPIYVNGVLKFLNSKIQNIYFTDKMQRMIHHKSINQIWQ